METRKIEFLKIYKSCENVNEARDKFKVSTNTIKKWRTDEEFDKEYRKIGAEKLRVGKRISEEEYKERIENFFEYLKHTNVTDALKKAHLGTHKFMGLKRNDKDFIKRYREIKGDSRSSKFDARLFSEKQKCICCKKTKPLAEFVHKKGLQRYILKTCHTCKNKNSEKKEGKAKSAIYEKLRKIEKDMQKFANSLDTEM